MLFEYRYQGNSAVTNRPEQTQMSFSPDTRRQPTFFSGELSKHVAFREGIGALHDVVISDQRFQPKDRSEYKAWLARQEFLDVDAIQVERRDLRQNLQRVKQELEQIYQRHRRLDTDFYKARRRYWNYLYKRDFAAWLILDPVITVHPDELFFECFSKDESSYGRLGVNYDVFNNIGEFSCGTTNIDYSDALYDEFQKIRSYKTTRFEIDPSGFEVETQDESSYKEVKIDLPDTWVRGFLQVSSAMSLPAVRFDLHPLDMHNFCFVLRRHKEKKGPRSMRYFLTPGEPIRVLFEPWNIEITCPRSIFTGDRAHEIRIWGRRRLHILERLLPVTRRFTVHLLGTGMPSFYVADLGEMSFTLGLSGWSSNDWSRAGNFDLMAPRADVDHHTKQAIFNALRENWREDVDQLSARTGYDRATVLSSLSAYTQAGRAIFDLNKNIYRVRELSKDPLPMETLRFANDREAAANRFVDSNDVKKLRARLDPEGNKHLSGTIHASRSRFQPQLTIDRDERMISATCSCYWYHQNKLYKGPCEHMLALRIAHRRDAS